MNGEQITKLWGVFALALLFYVLNTWLSSQGAHPILNVELLDSRRLPGALMALVICPPLLALTAAIGNIYRSRHADRGFWHAVPVPAIGPLDFTRTEARIYILVQLFLVYIVPMLSFLHFGRIVLSADVCVRHPDADGLSVWTIPELWRLSSGYRLDGWDATTKACTTGVTFWPLLQPIFLIGWTTGAAAYAANLLWKLSRYNRDVSNNSAPGL